MKTPAKITFRAKVESIHNVDGSLAYRFIPVPVFKKGHCDMNAFRLHPKYGSYANSDLFPGVLNRIRTEFFPKGRITMGEPLTAGVEVDTSKFLAVVTITIP